MKIKFIPLFTLVCCLSKAFAQTEAVKEQLVLRINQDKIKEYGYGSLAAEKAAEKPKIQPISNIDEVEHFVEEFYKERHAEIANNLPIDNFIKNYLSDKTDHKSKIIVFLKHQLDLEKLAGNDANAADANAAFHTVCEQIITHQSILFNLNAQVKGMNPEKLSVSNLSDYTKLVSLIKSETDLITTLEQQKAQAQKSYMENLAQIVEKEEFDSYFLYKENGEWSNYSLEKKEILFVILGGAKDIATYKVKIINNKNYLQTGIIGLKELAASLNIYKDSPGCLPASNINTDIPVTFLLLNKPEIKSPSTIKLNDKKDSTKYSFNIHEKTYWGIKVGLSFSDLNRKNFTLNAKNEVTVKLDTAQQKSLKTKLAAMIEFYPFGRDYDRLQPIWAGKQKTGFGDRIGLVAGLKIATDPLQDIYMGASFALSEDYSISFGAQFHSEPKDQKNLPVGLNTTPEYLKDNLAREYKTVFFVNLSLNPSAVSKLLGFNKK
jgi:hypothetical protein